MYSTRKTIREKGGHHFRTTEYGNLVKSNLERVSNLLGHKNNFSTIYMANSGTGAMEAVVENCVNQDDKVLVINGGTFGHRFCELLNWHNFEYSSIDLKWNETLTQEHFKQYENKDYTILFVNLHETSTGQLYDIKMISEFCKRNDMLLVVDAISTFLADDYEMDKNEIDVTIISSQKGLCLSPGMSIIALSDRMVERVKQNQAKTCYFDLNDYLRNITRGQTPYTPTVCIMYELEDMLNRIDKEGGKHARLATIEEKCSYFRKRAKELGLEIVDYPKSNMLTPVYFEDRTARKIIDILADKYRIFVNPCGGELAETLFRVSHIGNTTVDDIDDLLEKLMLSITEVKNGELVYDRK